MSQQNRQDSKMSNFNIGKKEGSISNMMCVVEINSTVLDFWLRQKSYTKVLAKLDLTQ